MARPYTIATFLFSHRFQNHTPLLIFYSSSYNKTLTFRITIFILLFMEVHHIYSALNLIERNKSNHHTYLLDKSEPKKSTPPSKSKKRTSKNTGRCVGAHNLHSFINHRYVITLSRPFPFAPRQPFRPFYPF